MSLYLGLDSSTQGLKGVLIDPARGTIMGSAAVNFGKDLPSYRCPEGTLPYPDPLVKHSDPLLWVAALDLLLQRLQASGAPLAEVRGIGGSGQQHGSVYLNAQAAKILASLNPRQDLATQLAHALSRKTSPIWMDSSTSAECAEIGQAIGPRLQTDTGSPAIERFTGPQIRKFFKQEPAAYQQTAQIHLVSSFMASVLIGGFAPIDYGDGAGMNLLNLKTLSWDPATCEATAPGLAKKLPKPVATSTVAGKLCAYFAKYGLQPGITVATWTGDNPASLVGTGAFRPGLGVISLGTSDTFFAVLDPYRTDPAGCGHVFGNPTGGFMCLTCFKNGSLARDRVRTESGVAWDFFDKTAFEKTPIGNQGKLALPWFEAEITPPVLKPGLRTNFDFASAAPEVRIRATVEAQALSLRAHSLWIGNFDTLRVTGGASRSLGIVQVLADVFQASVQTIAVPDSAALGAAMIAAHVAGRAAYEDLAAKFTPASN
ncbi:MAG TPA: FGGY family carbohydrate kinase, partial [Bacillota bacterium]|nr:FGGY family carbohydrate kinase [Bacillota bacterium]